MAGSEAENVREGSAARLPTGIQQLLLLGDNIGTVDLHPSIVMVESSRGGGRLEGGLTRFYCTTRRGGEGPAPIDFIVQTLHAGGQLQRAQSNKGLRKLILECSECACVDLCLNRTLPLMNSFTKACKEH